jgi:hypothetical protein
MIAVKWSSDSQWNTYTWEQNGPFLSIEPNLISFILPHLHINWIVLISNPAIISFPRHSSVTAGRNGVLFSGMIEDMIVVQHAIRFQITSLICIIS